MRDIDDYSIIEIFANSREIIGATAICSKLNESQTTIGRRLKALEDLGYLKKFGKRGRIITKKGLSYYENKSRVKAFEEKSAEYSELLGENANKNMNEFVEVRCALEVLAAKLACKNATASQLKQMEELLIQFAFAMRHGENTRDIDRDFHLLMAQASGNNYLYLQLKDLLTISDSYFTFYILAKDLGDHTVGLLQHEAILEAIKSKDENKAEKAVENHLQKVKKDINSYFVKN